MIGLISLCIPVFNLANRSGLDGAVQQLSDKNKSILILLKNPLSTKIRDEENH